MKLTTQQKQALCLDYEQWSGGIPPNADDIQDYVSLSLNLDVDEGEALDWLLTQISGWNDPVLINAPDDIDTIRPSERFAD